MRKFILIFKNVIQVSHSLHSAISITGGTVTAYANSANTVIGDATISSSSQCLSVNIGTGITNVYMYTGDQYTPGYVFYMYRYLKAAAVTIGSSEMTDLLDTTMNDRDNIIKLIKAEFPELIGVSLLSESDKNWGADSPY